MKIQLQGRFEEELQQPYWRHAVLASRKSIFEVTYTWSFLGKAAVVFPPAVDG